MIFKVLFIFLSSALSLNLRKDPSTNLDSGETEHPVSAGPVDNFEGENHQQQNEHVPYDDGTMTHHNNDVPSDDDDAEIHDQMHQSVTEISNVFNEFGDRLHGLMGQSFENLISAAKDAGFNKWLHNGEDDTRGYKQGVQDGFHQGFENGYREGFEHGKHSGHDSGYHDPMMHHYPHDPMDGYAHGYDHHGYHTDHHPDYHGHHGPYPNHGHMADDPYHHVHPMDYGIPGNDHYHHQNDVYPTAAADVHYAPTVYPAYPAHNDGAANYPDANTYVPAATDAGNPTMSPNHGVAPADTSVGTMVP